MTPEEEIEFFSWYRILRTEYPDRRKGQTLMNALGRTVPILYDMITDTAADPFYDDSRLMAFFNELGIPLYRVPLKIPGMTN